MSSSRSRAADLFAARLREELGTQDVSPQAVSDKRRAFREAACLLTRFDPGELRRLGDDTPGGAFLELVDDCKPLKVKGRCFWVLEPEVRQAALRGLDGPDAALRALVRNVAALPAAGPEQIALLQLTDRNSLSVPPPLEERPVQELADTLRAVEWLSQIPGIEGLPDVPRVLHALERARLLEPLEQLLRNPFEGRDEKVAELLAYIAPDGDEESTSPLPPMLIHGNGGVGKSTLLAKGILGSLHRRTPDMPFAYVDFDRPTISITEPIGLVAETARQLSIQCPDCRGELDALASECEQAARDLREEQVKAVELQRLATTRPTMGRKASQEFHRRATERETDLVKRVAEVVVARTPADGGPPLLIAVDSLEPAQYVGSPVVGRLWSIFAALKEVCPRLRFIACGSAPVGHPGEKAATRTIELGDLDMESAVSVLSLCGVTDPDTARKLADRVGGHPLSLRLAARAAELAGNEPTAMEALIDCLPRRRKVFFRKVDQLRVQGLLYDRILSRVPNEEVRRLARQSLVLRTITPEIIKDVLATHCGLKADSVDEARHLFDELSRLDQVVPTGPGAVGLRAEIRAVMLHLSDSGRVAAMRTIEQSAVTYYAGQAGAEARAEEIYHRLMLKESPRKVEERWMDGVEPFLVGASEDMTPNAAAFLTAHLGGEAPERVKDDADKEDWEQITAREVEDMLAQEFPEQAYVLLQEGRPWTPCSRLYPLLVETLDRTDAPEKARAVCAHAVELAQQRGCAEQQLELLMLSARLAGKAGDVQSAGQDFRAVEEIATGLGHYRAALGALAARARMEEGTPQGAAAESELASSLLRRTGEELADDPTLARVAAAEAGAQDPDAIAHTLDAVGLPHADDGVLYALGDAIDRAVDQQPLLRVTVRNYLNHAVPRPRADAEDPIAFDVLREARRLGILDDVVRRLFRLRDASGELRSGIRQAMAASTGPGAEQPMRYLSSEEIRKLRDAAVASGLDSPDARRLLLSDVPAGFRSDLPTAHSPLGQLYSDLVAMNEAPGLKDGAVPLRSWLHSAVDLTTVAKPLAVFQRALDKVARAAEGEPDIAADMPAREIREEIVHRDDTVPFDFLRGGEVAGTGVARITVPSYEAGAPLPVNGGRLAGTGWLIAPDLLITNHHIVNARPKNSRRPLHVQPDDLQTQARHSRSRFGFDADDAETDDSTAGELVAYDEHLDYAILRLTAEPCRPVLQVATGPLAVAENDYVAVNIIQHPGGQAKRVALRNNLVYQADDDEVRYFTDTRSGSSGSPVLTDDWTVVALHRATKRVENVAFHGRSAAFVNVATQMSSIMRHIQEHHPAIYREISAAQEDVRAEAEARQHTQAA
ncbi:trypsin-like peptidase domain-containing protein [Streptomyces sp. NPDC051907]|uniref:trypsin-like peptidase domain-containing protein n=1 Tax=Streptomyces sp. NPDC051907 TaxID=3155284 RepID=UPI0034350D36